MEILPAPVEAVSGSVFLVLFRGLVGEVGRPVIRLDVVRVGDFHALGAGSVDDAGDDLVRPDGDLLPPFVERDVKVAAGPGWPERPGRELSEALTPADLPVETPNRSGALVLADPDFVRVFASGDRVPSTSLEGLHAPIIPPKTAMPELCF